MSTPNNTHQHAFSYNDWTLNKRNPLPIEEKGKPLARDTDTRRARTLAPPHRPGEGAACKACRGRSVTQAIAPGTRAPGNQAHTSPRWKGSENKGQMSPGPPGPQRTGRRAKACSESGRGGRGEGARPSSGTHCQRKAGSLRQLSPVTSGALSLLRVPHRVYLGHA